MTLSEFIRANMEAILNEWQQFAATIPSASAMDQHALRDDAEAILLAIALDMESAQSDEEQKTKSRGHKARSAHKQDTAAETHGGARFAERFTVKEMVSEYRALRASVIRLWVANHPAAQEQGRLYELTRFNEGIDQALTDSIARFSDRLDHARELFMGVLGHDLRTPVHVILQSTPVLSRALGTAEQQRQAAARIDRSAQHIDKMLRDLLDVARTRLGDSLPLDRQPMDAGEVCARIVRDMRALYPNHDLNYESEGDLKGVWDAARLDQLLSNLVRNAIQHGDAASTVTLRSIGEPERVVFDVHNFGRPIPPSKLPHIFEPLVRGDEGSGAQGRSGSMGLGLYIASTIAKAHRGTLTATSSLEHGTLFTARLPRTQEQRESTPAQGS